MPTKIGTICAVGGDWIHVESSDGIKHHASRSDLQFDHPCIGMPVTFASVRRSGDRWPLAKQVKKAGT